LRKFITFVLFLIAILAIFPIYTRFKVSAEPVAPGVHLGGLDMSDVKATDEIRVHLEGAYSEPIAVYFDDQRLVLEPSTVDFYIDVDQMIAEAGQYLEGPDFLDIALRHAAGLEQRRRDVPVRYMLNQEKLRAWLETVAVEQNRPPQPARVLPPGEVWQDGVGPAVAGLPADYVGSATRDWQWNAGSPGYELDIDASIPLVIEALASENERAAELSLIEIPSQPPNMDDLGRALDDYLSSFPGFAAVYVRDIGTGEEAHVDDEVAFSGMSTLKIGIVSAIMQQIEGITVEDQASREIGQWIDFALGESNNFAANLLVKQLGNGDIPTGARRFTDFMRQLGFESTFMQSGYDVQTQLAQIPTPGNQRDDWSTNPDSNLQSTPRDMGRLLTAVYECTQGHGLFIETFSESITPGECEHILYYMSHDEFQELLWSGLPKIEESWIVHKHGFAFESHSDVGLIWGPTGPYVLSVFLFRDGWMDWETSNEAMKNVSRIVWNFFEFQQQLLDEETPPPPELKPPPGYVPLGEFVPAS